MFNIFNDPAFSIVSMTNAINIIPNKYSRLQELGLFNEKPQTTRTVVVEEQYGVLNLLPTLPEGSPGTVGTRSKRKMRSFTIPHIPHDDVVLPKEVQGVREFGSENQLRTVASVMATHLQTMRDKHAITLEHLKFGALKGLILDADGSVIYNLFDEFEVKQKIFKFNISQANSDFNVKKICLDLKRYVEDNLQGEICSGLHVLVGEEFFDALTNHHTVKEAYNRWQDGSAFRDDMRTNFSFAGIMFEEHRGLASTADGEIRRFVEPNEGHLVPLGTSSTFMTHYAPADMMDAVNTIALPLYAMQESRDFNRGTDIHTQSNPLPLCHRPKLLVKLEMI